MYAAKSAAGLALRCASCQPHTKALCIKGNIVKINFIILLMLSLLGQPAISGDFAQEANDNPFLNGELNAKYKGEATALAGEILEIKQTKQKYPVYKLNLRIKNIKNIWVTSIAPPPKGGVNIGDMIVFKGFISTASELDPSGELETLIKSKTLLMAVQSQRAN